MALSPLTTHLDRLSISPYGTPDVPGALLELTSTSGTLLLPRMTGAQAGSIPVNGQAGFVVYVTDGATNPFLIPGIYFFDGTAWNYMASNREGFTTGGAILTDGVATVLTDAIQPNSGFLVSYRNINNPGFLSVPTANVIPGIGGSFQIHSTSDTDAGFVAWQIINK